MSRRNEILWSLGRLSLIILKLLVRLLLKGLFLALLIDLRKWLLLKQAFILSVVILIDLSVIIIKFRESSMVKSINIRHMLLRVPPTHDWQLEIIFYLFIISIHLISFNHIFLDVFNINRQLIHTFVGLQNLGHRRPRG